MWYLQENNGMRTTGLTLNVDFVETSFTGWMDFTVVQYSATNNGLPSSIHFCFKRECSQC
jgi:hypothetical protein